MSKVEQADLGGAQVLGWIHLWSRQGSGEASGMVALQQRRKNPVYVIALGSSPEQARQRGADEAVALGSECS